MVKLVSKPNTIKYQNISSNFMDNITLNNLLSFLNDLPQEEESYQSEEIHTSELPAEWKMIGTLGDNRIGANFVSYKPWFQYAIGFYPYSGCDIYRNKENNKIILSYIELGGHFPFRRNFTITKKSPFVFEPISFDVSIHESDNETFLSSLRKYGLTIDKIENDILNYKNIDQINHELNPNDTLVVRRYFDHANKIFHYSIITKRENAVNIKSDIEQKTTPHAG